LLFNAKCFISSSFLLGNYTIDLPEYEIPWQSILKEILETILENPAEYGSLRNIAIIGAPHTGKTTFAEQLIRKNNPKVIYSVACISGS